MEFPTVPIAAIRAYHANERHLFSRMVLDLGLDPARSMELIAFWLWLEENGHANVVRRISSLDDAALRSVADVGRSFIDALRVEPPPPPTDVISVELPPNLRFRQAAIQGITYYLHSVCYKAFDDIVRKAEERETEIRRMEILVQQMSRTYLDDVNRSNRAAATPFSGQPYVPHGEGTSRGVGRRETFADYNVDRMLSGNGHGIPQMMFDCYTGIAPMAGAAMDPAMFNFGGSRPYYFNGESSWAAAQPNIPRDERTLFVTFSNGYPLTEEELYNFFMRRYGDVEVVTVQNVIGGGNPLFAHVSFYSLATVLRILNGNVKVKFMTNGKHLWARRFIPKREL